LRVVHSPAKQRMRSFIFSALSAHLRSFGGVLQLQASTLHYPASSPADPVSLKRAPVQFMPRLPTTATPLLLRAIRRYTRSHHSPRYTNQSSLRPRLYLKSPLLRPYTSTAKMDVQDLLASSSTSGELKLVNRLSESRSPYVSAQAVSIRLQCRMIS
jgi:hypothetical protein